MADKKKTAAAAKAGDKKPVDRNVDGFATATRFVGKKGSRFEVVMRAQRDGQFKVYALMKPAKKDGEKVTAQRGMPTAHATKEEAQARYDALVADAKKAGWAPKTTVTRSAFDSIPSPE